MRVFVIILSYSYLLFADTSGVTAIGPNSFAILAKDKATVEVHQGPSEKQMKGYIDEALSKGIRAGKKIRDAEQRGTTPRSGNSGLVIEDSLATKIALFEIGTTKRNQLDSLFRQLTFKIQEGLTPNSRVLQNVSMKGRVTGTKRTVDILLKDSIGQIEILIGFKCLNLNIPVDVNEIAAASELFNDIGARYGVIVSATPFVASAAKRASAEGIILYRLQSKDYEDWKTTIEVPFVLDYMGMVITRHKLVIERFNSDLPEVPYEKNPTYLDEATSTSLLSGIYAAYRKPNYPDTPGNYVNVRVDIDTFPIAFKFDGKKWYYYSGGHDYYIRTSILDYTLTREIYAGHANLLDLVMLTDVNSKQRYFSMSDQSKFCIRQKDIAQPANRIHKVPSYPHEILKIIGSFKTFAESDSFDVERLHNEDAKQAK